MEYIRINIAGHTVQFAIPCALRASLENQYRLFFSSGNPEIRIDLTLTPIPLPEESFVGAEIINGILTVADGHSHCALDIASGKGVIKTDLAHFLRSLADFLRNIFILLVMLKDEGVSLHAAGILKGDETYVFIGPSGAGKSTIARCSPDKVILDDDLILLKRSGDKFAAFPAPAWDSRQRGIRLNHAYTVKRLFWLVKDTRVSIEEKPRLRALANIFTMPQMVRQAITHDDLLQRFADLLAEVPCYDLHFLPDESFWPHIEKLECGEYALKEK